MVMPLWMSEPVVFFGLFAGQERRGYPVIRAGHARRRLGRLATTFR